jgi:hypothetical protein
VQARGTRFHVARAGVPGGEPVVLLHGLMRSRFVLGGMAAIAEGDGTGFASLGGYRLPGARMGAPLLTLAGDHAMRRFAAHPSFSAR